MRLKILSMALLIFLAAAPVLAVAEEEPYVSLTVLGGFGTASDRFGDGAVTRFSVGLDYPLVERFTLLAKWDHEQTKWDDQLWRSRCAPLLDGSTGGDVFSFGMRVDFK